MDPADPYMMAGMGPQAMGVLPYGVGGYPNYTFPGLAQAPQSLPFQFNAPLFQGTTPPYYQPFRLPFLDSLGPMGPLANMAAAIPLQNFLASNGYFPGGMDRGVNFVDRLANARFLQEQQQALQYGAMIDQQSLQRTFQGISQLTGTPYGAEQARFVDRLSGQLTSIVPYVAPYAPGIVEQFMGPQGSAAILSQNLALQGRYRLDPVTGAAGYSPETIRSVAQSLTDSFANDPGGRFAGITLGETGVLFGELQRRGVLEATNAPAGLDPGQARQLEGTKVRDQLSQYVGVIRAMREIFGDAGQPDAPIPQLIQGLDQLTQGGLSRLNPTQLESTVRNIRNLAQTSGLGMEGFARISQFAGGEAQAQGGGGTLGLEAAMGSAAYAAALRDSNIGAVSGMPSLEALAQQDARLRVAAGRSEVANQIGVVENLFAGNSGLENLRQRAAAAGTPEAQRAVAFVEAYRSGQSNFLDPVTGQQRSIGSVNTAEFLQTFSPLVTGGQGALTDLLGSSDFNRQLAERYANTIRDSQFESDIIPRATNRINASLTPLLGGSLSPEQVSQTTEQLLASYRDLGVGGADPETVRQEFQRILVPALRARGVANPEQAARDAAAQAVSALSTVAPEGMKFSTLAALFSPEVSGRANAVTAASRAQSVVQETFSRLSFEGPIASAIRAIQEATPETGVEDIVSRTLGGIPKEELAEMEKLLQARTTFLEEAARNPTDAAAVKRARDEFERNVNPILQGLRERQQSTLPVSAEDLGRLERWSEALGGSFAALSPEQATAALSLPAEQGGATTGQVIGEFLTSYEDVARRSLSREQSLLMLGEQGAESLRGGLGASQQLRALANIYTDGDVGRLLAGDIPGVSPQEAAAIRKQAQDQFQAIRGASSTASTSMTAPPLSPERRAAMLEQGGRDFVAKQQSLPGVGSTEDLAAELLQELAPGQNTPENVERIASLLVGKEEVAYTQLAAGRQLREGVGRGVAAKQAGELGNLIGKGGGSSLEALEKALQSESFRTQVQGASKTKLQIDVAKVDIQVRVTGEDGVTQRGEVVSSDIKFEGGDVETTPTTAAEYAGVI